MRSSVLRLRYSARASEMSTSRESFGTVAWSMTWNIRRASGAIESITELSSSLVQYRWTRLRFASEKPESPSSCDLNDSRSCVLNDVARWRCRPRDPPGVRGDGINISAAIAAWMLDATASTDWRRLRRGFRPPLRRAGIGAISSKVSIVFNDNHLWIGRSVSTSL